MDKYHKTVEKILNLLKENNCWYETFEHEPVRTSEEAAKLRHGYTLHQGAKALIIRAKIPNEGKQFIMVVIPGDTKFNNDKVKELLHAKDTRFATEEELTKEQITTINTCLTMISHSLDPVYQSELTWRAICCKSLDEFLKPPQELQILSGLMAEHAQRTEISEYKKIITI